MKKFLILSMLLITGLIAAKTYTLENLIEAGLNNATSFKQKQILLKNADLSVKAAAWDLMPSANVSAQRSLSHPKSPIDDGTGYSSTGALVISKSIALNDPTFFNYWQTRMDKTLALLDMLQSKKEMVYSIYTAWLDINQTKKEITIRTQNLGVLQKIMDQTILQKQLGQRTSFDVSQNDINVINAQLAIAELNNQLAKQKADLFNRLKIQDAEADVAEAPELTSEATLDFTGSKRESFLLMKLKEDMNKSQLDKIQQKSNLFPSLELSGTYAQRSQNNDVLNIGDYQDSYTLSLGLSWSLWSPWTKGNNYARIKNSLLLKQWQYDDGLATQTLDQANLQREWQYLQETLNLNTRKAKQAKDNLLIATEKYNLGTFSLIELEQARVSSLEADLAVNNITYQMQKKIQEWNLLNSLLVLDKY